MATATKKSVPPQPAAYPSRRALRYQQKQAQGRNRIIAAIAVVVVAAGIVLGVVMFTGGDKAVAPPPFVGTTLNIGLGDYTIFGDLTAPAGHVRLHAVNQGGIVHNVGVRGKAISGDIKPGGSFTLDVGVLTPGTYDLWCDIVGHVAKGMVAKLTITQPLPSPSSIPPATG